MGEREWPPGPWYVDPDDRPDMEWNNHVVTADGGRICFMAHSGKRDNAKHEAALWLIVAAPDLYEALEAQIAAHKLLCAAAGLDAQAHLDGTAQARNALARARGETLNPTPRTTLNGADHAR